MPGPAYHLPPGLVAALACDVVRQRPRSLVADSRRAVRGLQPALRVQGHPWTPETGPAVVVVNHYARPGFSAWWIPLAVGSGVAPDMHWIMTNAWTFPGRPLARTVWRPLGQRFLQRIARVYGLTGMPPMPPEPGSELERALAVRQVLAYVRRTPLPLLGLAPEGRDAGEGVLQWPPPGAGRFLHHLAAAGLVVLPVGVFEAGGGLCLHWGVPCRGLDDPAGGAPDLDRRVAGQVMAALAALLPVPLRGEFGA